MELIETPEDNIKKFRISGTLPRPPQTFMKKVERNRGNGLYFINIFNSHLDKVVVVVILPLLEKHLGMGSQVISNVPEGNLREKLFKYFSSISYGYLAIKI